ncbi:helix-turn-helix domain-containing protein [Streptomyces sp. NPDC058457]|uniref:helix-turn-helix domain-containing protein n=1 Tax=Streptomyces sp. NPDC058457 TaxID=3346507 RepID=UPI00366309FD
MDTHTSGAPSPVQRFASELRRLRIMAGNLQVKTIAARAQCSPATVSEALNGRRLPGETVTCRLVAVLGGDWSRWQALWREARTELDTLKREGAEAPAEPLRVEMVRHPDPTSFYRAAAGRQQLTGFSVEGPAFLAYFADGFDQAWGAPEPLDAYVARHCRWRGPSITRGCRGVARDRARGAGGARACGLRIHCPSVRRRRTPADEQSRLGAS